MTYDPILKVDFKEVFDANENINLMVERLEDDAISTRSKNVKSSFFVMHPSTLFLFP
jgi:hypothetical protein